MRPLEREVQGPASRDPTWLSGGLRKPRGPVVGTPGPHFRGPNREAVGPSGLHIPLTNGKVL